MLLSRHQHAGQIYDIKIKEVFWKCGRIQIFGNYRNISKPDSGENEEETECLLPLRPEPYVFSSAV
jgi:hypothetical protein